MAPKPWTAPLFAKGDGRVDGKRDPTAQGRPDLG
jgi:hypothetical protein